MTTKRELENYLHWRAINKFLEGSHFHSRLTRQYDDFEDDPNLLSEYLRAEQPTAWNENMTKKKLANKAASHMTLEWLNEIDPNEELIGVMR